MGDELPWAAYVLIAISTGAVLAAAGEFTRNLATRAATGSLKRNGMAGIRTKATQASDEAWLAAHVAGEAGTRRAGTVMIVTAIVSFAIPSVLGLLGLIDSVTALIMWTVLLLLGTGATLWFAIRASITGNRAALETLDGQDR